MDICKIYAIWRTVTDRNVTYKVYFSILKKISNFNRREIKAEWMYTNEYVLDVGIKN